MRTFQNVANIVSGMGRNVSWEVALKYENPRYKELQKNSLNSCIASSFNSCALPSPTFSTQYEIPSWLLLLNKSLELFLHHLYLLTILLGNQLISVPNSKLTNDEFWSYDIIEPITEFLEVFEFIQQNGALLPPQPQVSYFTHTIRNSLWKFEQYSTYRT